MRIGSVQLETNLLLAPLARHTDLAFRLVVRRQRGPAGGVGLACTELICSQTVHYRAGKSIRLAESCPEDRPLAVQLYGRDPDLLAEAARWAEGSGADLVDINMGCPVDKITKTNGGSKLLCEPALAVEVARRAVQAVRVPVTVKMRLGWDDTCLNAPTLAAALAGVGVAAITVHGRTTRQMFRDRVRLEGIARVVEALRSFPAVPVIGNGDVRSPPDARRMLEATGCHGVMIGRGALGQPWIFADAAAYLREGRAVSLLRQRDRARVVLEHFELAARQRGERGALNLLRQWVSWYSPHLQPWPRLKSDVHGLTTAEQFRDYWRQALERMDRGDAPAAAPGAGRPQPAPAPG